MPEEGRYSFVSFAIFYFLFSFKKKILQKRGPEPRNEQAFQSNKQHRLVNVVCFQSPHPLCPNIVFLAFLWKRLVLLGFYCSKANLIKICFI